MKDFIMEIGFFLFLIGGCLADSENLWISFMFVLLGILLVLIGGSNDWRKRT